MEKAERVSWLFCLAVQNQAPDVFFRMKEADFNLASESVKPFVQKIKFAFEKLPRELMAQQFSTQFTANKFFFPTPLSVS